ncbi:MAG: hypothetical protein ACC700_20935, partial [Anaerolineales bacterium]
ATAHGEVAFSGFDIEFGSVQPEIYIASDFLRLYDELIRTCNSAAIAILLFWARHSHKVRAHDDVPLSIIEQLAAGGLNRPGLRLLGVVRSNTPLGGSQLHAAVSLDLRSRGQVLGECARVAFHLLESGARGFDRFLVQVDHGEHVASLVIIDSEKLTDLLECNALEDRLPEAFSETQLVWFDERRLKTRLRMWLTIIRTGWSWFKAEVIDSWHNIGLLAGRGRYLIREVESLSSQGVSRLRIKAVLTEPLHSEDRAIVREVIRDIVSRYRWLPTRSRSRILDPGIPLPKRPTHIFVDLFLADGTLRWLGGGGWVGGNIVAVAEFARGRADPVLIDNPEETYKGIRIRYSMDAERAEHLEQEFAVLMQDIWSSRSNSS